VNILEWLFPPQRAAELNTDQAVRDEIADTLDDLSGDELLVIRRIVDRIAMGRRTYGELRLAGDKRDWNEELANELLDGCVYAAIRIITQGR